jgi:cell division protease FtsH
VAPGSSRRAAHALLAKETLDEDEAYAAADVPRDEAPGVLARGDVPGILRDPGAPPRADAVVRATSRT